MENNIEPLKFVFPNTNQEIRVVKNTLDNTLWFVARDLAEVLDIANIRTQLQRFVDFKRLSNKDLAEVILKDSLGRRQKTTIISESAMYTIVIRSDKPIVIKFQNWVTKEVLPQIRKTGKYKTEDFIQECFNTLNNFPENENMLGNIYFIKCQGYIKIGFSTNVEKRLYSIQTGNPFPCTLLGTIPNKTFKDERNLHQQFKDKHHKLEWYTLTEKDILPLLS